jgi:hypothetical protein
MNKPELPELPPEYEWGEHGYTINVTRAHYNSIFNDTRRVHPGRGQGVAWLHQGPDFVLVKLCPLHTMKNTWREEFSTIEEARGVVAAKLWLGEWE